MGPIRFSVVILFVCSVGVVEGAVTAASPRDPLDSITEPEISTAVEAEA